MEQQQFKSYYRLIAKGILLAAAVIILLWFVFKLVEVLLLFFLAVVLAMVFKCTHHLVAEKKLFVNLVCTACTFVVLVFLAMIGWLIIPKVAEELAALVNGLPASAIHFRCWKPLFGNNFFTILIYMLLSPRPHIEAYLFLLPKPKRQKAAQALTHCVEHGYWVDVVELFSQHHTGGSGWRFFWR